MTNFDVFQRLTDAGMSPVLALDVASGATSEVEAWRETELHRAGEAISALADKDWPRPDVAWDVSSVCWHRSMDDHTTETFRAAFPDAIVAWVDMAGLHKALERISRPRKGPFSVDHRSKAARLVAHLVAGGRVSPPFVRLNVTGLIVVGGNHRLAWARYRRQRMIPILIEAAAQVAIKSMVPSLSSSPPESGIEQLAHPAEVPVR